MPDNRDLHHWLAAVMVMCAMGIKQGTNTVGDLVMINANDDPALPALILMGHGLREIKQR